MLRRAFYKVLLLGVWGLFPVCVMASEKPQRIVSLGVCADQYVLGLVSDHSRISALSPDANKPHISLQHEKAKGLTTISGSAEEILLLQPDMVLSPQWQNSKTIQVLQQTGIPVVLLSVPVTFHDIRQETRKIASALGEQEQVDILLAELEEVLNIHERDHKKVAAYFMPGGYSAGQNTFVDTVITSAGYDNLTSQLGLSGWTTLSLEQLVLQRPDVLIMSFFQKNHQTLASRLRQHSAMQHLIKQTPVIDMPDKYWACGGWFLFKAIDYLREKRV